MLFILVVSPSLFVGVFQVIAVIVAVIFMIVIVGVLYLRWKIYRIQKGARGAANGANGTGSNPYESFFRSAQNSTQGANRGSASRPTEEGNVRVVAQQNQKKVSDDVGEYVEFEEVKEESK